MRFHTVACLVACLLASLLAVPAAAQEGGFQDELLGRLEGSWVMRGDIAGQQVVHDITAEWVLAHNYLRLHELSRELTPDGEREYEAIVFLGQGRTPGSYACLWLDVTGGEGLSNDAMGYGQRDGDSIPFEFKMPDGSGIRNTFAYDRDTDSWHWAIDNVAGDQYEPFARVTLTRQ